MTLIVLHRRRPDTRPHDATVVHRARRSGTGLLFLALLLALALGTILTAALIHAPAPALAATRSAIPPPSTTTTTSPPPTNLPVFHLPFPAGRAFMVSQGNGGHYTHEAGSASEFAWDFDMPEGTPVVAAAAGRVVYVKQEYQGGGFTNEYQGKANYVVIEHANGLHSLYFHLAYQGVVVQDGQYVQAGQMIALSGNTGHSTGPHLHFEVEGESWPNTADSIPVTFAEAGVPSTGSLPVSANLYTPNAPTPFATTAGLALTGVGPDEGLRSVYTHQLVPLLLRWASADQPVRPPGPAPPTVPVRLVAADASGNRTIVATGSTPTGSAAGGTPGLETLQGTLQVVRQGWLTLWAEYDSGGGWNAVADSSGGLVAVTLSAEAADALLSPPGLHTAPAAVPDGSGSSVLKVKTGVPIEVSFGLTNPGDTLLHVFRVGARLVSESGAVLTSPDSIFKVTPVTVDAYLFPGGAIAWSGTLTPLRKGVYRLLAGAADASYISLPLPPLRTEYSASVMLVVEDPGGPVDPSTPAFADVDRDDPAFSAIQFLAARGVISGYPNPAGGLPLFQPQLQVSRAQFAKMIVGALRLPVTEADICPFPDVLVSGPGDLYPDNFVAVAARAGLTLGVTVDPPRFDPYGNVTRRQAGLMAERADPDLSEGIPGDPWSPATRAEIAVLLARLLRN